MHTVFAIGLVFLGCTSNVVFLELLVRDFPGCGNLVTFGQFLFIALEGLIFQAHFFTKPRAIPLRNYFIMVTMFFIVSVVNNYALNFNIPMPLHMIFRSGSLIASMVLGIIILKKRYTVAKYISVALVSLGIFICTFMSAKQVSSRTSASADEGYYVFIRWLIELMEISLLGITVPIMWFYLVLNVLTQYICIRGVFILTTECTSLTVTLVVTLRKFISLIFSIVYFKNPFTFWHWIGTVVVFIGTLTYAEVWNTFKLLFHSKRKLQ
ncbi:UDP-xylose and UDP-N-acetylglucosamine transporter isoform X2 [Rhincodon typus]|uniref:UDP-xylose and UDP-N-acetylglucosamine transporter isoform X2 n=1 Tax=Rhincodon typus TaxID=259920 RepID=UPI002030904F|nr:UDP-xylose and UDP-N-acetylglucosamine transporter isoform X2 [Rhincodon typus]